MAVDLPTIYAVINEKEDYPSVSILDENGLIFSVHITGEVDYTNAVSAVEYSVPSSMPGVTSPADILDHEDFSRAVERIKTLDSIPVTVGDHIIEILTGLHSEADCDECDAEDGEDTVADPDEEYND